ncbi:MAG: alpha/beta hydrolase [Spirochaetes bacterium]|nr:alpha/beta hydrolase [Spirochaetota bacterium]
MISILTVIIIVSFNGCQSAEPTDDSEQTFTYLSKVVNDCYQISVSLPENYNTDDRINYSVVYLLDANWTFEGVKEFIASNKELIEPVILVGICQIQALQPGYTGTDPSRCRDYTPTSYQPALYPDSGGAHNFGEFLKTELIPYIDSSYRTISGADNRCIIGGSLGGLFVCYSAINYNDTFRKFLAVSPSLWWDNFVFMKLETEYASTHTELNASFFTTASTGEDSIMVKGVNDLADLLFQRKYSGLSYETRILSGYTHEAAQQPGIELGISWLLPIKK